MNRFAILIVSIGSALFAQDQPPRSLNDALLEKMTGKWTLTGTLLKQNATHCVTAKWVLNHQFLEIHEKDAAAQPAYEAIVLVGWDGVSERYVAHWIDIFGGRTSETIGYGIRSGDRIEFRLEYPDGPFLTTFHWSPEHGEWQWLMRTKNKSGQWEEFGNMNLARQAGTRPDESN